MEEKEKASDVKELTFTADDSASGMRVDLWISSRTLYSRNAVQRLCDERKVLVNGIPVGKNYRISENQDIRLLLDPPKEANILPQDIPLDVVYEDGDLLVVNKPKGMVVHPAPGNPDKTLVNALLAHCGDTLSGIGGVIRPGIVHRIDKDTSGLLLVAKHDTAHKHLAKQIKEHSFARRYHAVVYGNLKSDDGLIDAPVGRHPVDRKRMAVTEKNGRPAQTKYHVLERFGSFTYLELELYTGRTHQIRVHMAHQGHPVAGDPVYGPRKVIQSLQGQCLHAKSIGFLHPGTGQWLNIESQLPEYFKSFLTKLRHSAEPLDI